MEGCPNCKAGKQSFVRFGPSLVTACSNCHALAVSPVVDARIPSIKDHVKALQEEIGVEEQEGDTGKKLKCHVEEAGRSAEGAKLRVQVMEGNPRWVLAGSRMEGFLEGEEESANIEVAKKGGSSLEIEVSDPRWADLRRGAAVTLRPQTNATLYRNILKAFLVVVRRFPSISDLQDPKHLPTIAHKSSGADEEGLRPSQAKALRAAGSLPERGILMVQGPPGTGKTTVIARLLAEEARKRRTVLVTSHTHVAIDNALRKALKHTPNLAEKMVRLGESGRVSVDLVYLQKKIGQFRMDPEQEGSDKVAVPLFENLQDKHPVVGMTLDALSMALLSADMDNQEIRPFDTVIVDEAGMNAFPKIAIAHAVARRLVLVGDPLQLPPIVRAWSFRNDENYKRSHFEVLQMSRPDLSVLLDEQFRCHPAIYEWSKDAVYGGQVQSRTPARPIPVASLLGTKLHSPVVWIDTTRVPGNAAEQVGTSRANPTHTRIAIEVIRDLLKQKIAPEEIGYIAPFRAQALAFAEATAQDPKLHAMQRVTAATVDAFQGNERRAIVFDVTTLGPAKPHEDHRRLNVSLTRAQELLVIIGPRPFVRSAKENPFFWSLQNWKAAQVVATPIATASA